jgi:hydrogenase-1 operon protein HyaF
MSLQDIPVMRAEDVEAGGCLPAVISEIGEKLDALLATGRGGSVDLRSLPMTPAERGQLAAFLGDGEVSARIDALGPTYVRETGIAGVWWVEHRNEDGQVTAELVEVTYLPEILRTDPADARVARERLHAQRRLLEDDGDADG